MAVRNWWIELEIDGRTTRLEGGPRSKNGGFRLTIHQRTDGISERAFSAYGNAFENGTLSLHYMPQTSEGLLVGDHNTIRSKR